jgi:tetratricopeptide (TPR) repeat protein
MPRWWIGLALWGIFAWGDSRSCAECHAAIWETYQRTGMARSFSRTAPTSSTTFYHRASDTYFAMAEHDGRWFQQQYQMVAGKQANFSEKSVDLTLGSGNHARTFLHRADSGELIELPLGWYAEKGGVWAMNPGYDRPDHEGVRRRIGYDCMFCHNAYPEIPAGSGPRSAPVYRSIPEGIDCQRCHGDGREHVELARRNAPRDEIWGAILNPARLSPERQLDVCMQCHLETTSSPLPNSIVRYEREPFSYRPNEPLGDFIVHFDRTAKDDRFEINSSAYRLRQSACFLKSEGRMACTTCHNPHDVQHGEQATQHYNSVCKSCHGQAEHTRSGNCVECHMPKRRTDDVVHAAMTDHLIQRRRPTRDLLAEMQEKPPALYRGEVIAYDPPQPGDLYLAVAQVAEGANLSAGIARLSAAIQKYKPEVAEYDLQLGDALQKEDRALEAIRVYERALQREPDSRAASERLALAFSATKQYARAELTLKQVLGGSARDGSVWTQLGSVYLAEGKRADALAAFERAVTAEPDLAEAHNSLGVMLLESSDMPPAEEAFREAIRIKPNYPEARYNYALLLSRMRRFDDARVQLDALLHIEPRNAEAHQLLGNVLGAKGDLRDAIAHFREVVAIRPDSARANLDLGATLEAAGEKSAALPYLRKAAASADVLVREEANRILSRIESGK